MGAYVFRRVIYAVVTLLVVSVVAYVIIQLPPGDYLTSYIMRLEMQGGEVTDAEVETLKREYGFDLPAHLRYFKWMANLLRGDLGRSFFYNRPVLELLAERLPLSLLVSLLALLFTYLVSIPVGIYSATHQYSVWDYTLSFVGFVGLATPNFILALLLMFFFKTFGRVSRRHRQRNRSHHTLQSRCLCEDATCLPAECPRCTKERRAPVLQR